MKNQVFWDMTPCPMKNSYVLEELAATTFSETQANFLAYPEHEHNMLLRNVS
jgi:hypothetical protein